jgi:hypothetical protein
MTNNDHYTSSIGDLNLSAEDVEDLKFQLENEKKEYGFLKQYIQKKINDERDDLKAEREEFEKLKNAFYRTRDQNPAVEKQEELVSLFYFIDCFLEQGNY